MIGPGFAALSALLFALTNILIRRGIPSESTRAGLLLMTVINCLVLVTLLGVLVIANGLPQGNWLGVLWFAAAGVAGPLLGQWALMGSIARIGASKGSALKNAAPAVTVGLAFLLIGETLSSVALTGMVLVFAGLGVLVVSVWREGDHDPTRPDTIGTPLEGAGLPTVVQPMDDLPPKTHEGRNALGLALGLGAAFGMGVSQMLRKVGMLDMPEAVLGAAVSSITALIVVLALRPSYVLGLAARAHLRRHFNRWMVFAGIASSGGQVAFYLALDTLEVSRVALIVGSDVVLTMILAALLLRDYERVSPTVIASAVLVLCGVITVSVG